MQYFVSGVIERQPIPQSLLQTIRLLGEYKGKQALFQNQSPQVLETLRQIAVIQSTESSNRIEGIATAPQRLQLLMADKVSPQSRSEQEILGYREVLNSIHANHDGMTFTPGLVLQLHRDLTKFLPIQGGVWKGSDNDIRETHADGTTVVRFRPVPAYLTPQAMQDLHGHFNQYWQEGTIEPLLLIATYSLDFLCVHPFLDGNGRMARLLSLLLLYQAGYEVGRYISLEAIIERTKESYYETLQRCSQRWHEGEHELLPWWEYFLGVVLSAYREFEQRVGVVTTQKGAKQEMVADTIARLPQQFQISDIQKACPTVSRPTINRVLAHLKQEGRVHCVKGGRDALWEKLGSGA
jgi:Fic family protein